MRRVDATYKSEPLPENSDETKIRKMVGKNFIEEVFEQQDKSVMVLFIDSKDEQSHQEINLAVQRFADKYYEAYKDRMNVGIFDLAKNEHQSLTINSAPELVIFERTNKKKPKFFKGSPSEDTIKNFVNYEVRDITIP